MRNALLSSVALAGTHDLANCAARQDKAPQMPEAASEQAGWSRRCVQYLGLLAERWFFFAQANHPQNLYYQTVA